MSVGNRPQAANRLGVERREVFAHGLSRLVGRPLLSLYGVFSPGHVFHVEVSIVDAGHGIVAPHAVAGPLWSVMESAFGAANLGHPRYFASPNVCPFPSCASSVGHLDEGFFGSAIAVLANVYLCIRSSSLMVPSCRRAGLFGSGSNLNCRYASDTNALPKDATTNHYRKKRPHLNLEPHKHLSPVSLLIAEVRQRRGLEAEKS